MVSQVYYCEGKSVLLAANGEYLENPKKRKAPQMRGFHWRWEAELNRCKRICSPLPNRSAIPPVKCDVLYQKDRDSVNWEFVIKYKA